MQTPPIHNLPKKEIVWLATHRCAHSHTFLEHYACYEKLDHKKERIGFLDIEFYNFDANYGRMISYCILDSLTGQIFEDVITTADIAKGGKEGHEDKRLTEHLIKDMMQFDRLVTFYGKRCDIPYIRTRAIKCGLDFPNYGTLKHTDLYFIVKYKMKLNRNGLENACRSLLGKTDKTHVENAHWIRAMRGDKKSLSYILQHNRYDVQDTQKLYNKIINFVSKTDTSI